MRAYSIQFDFRGQPAAGRVHDFDHFCLVSLQRDDILDDFSSELKFSLPDKKYRHAFMRNPEARDLQDLIRAIQPELKVD